MRLVFLIPWITQGRGGTENVGQMMANAMSNRGHEVHIFTFDDLKRPSTFILDPKINLHHLPTKVSDAVDSQMTLAIGQLLPDLIVGLHMNRTLLRYVKCGQKLGIPVVLSEHIDPHFPERINTNTPLERLTAFQGATKIHLLVDAFRDPLPEHLKKRSVVIANTVPAAVKTAKPEGKPDSKTLLTVARLVPRKNIARLISEFGMIANKFPEWTLKIVGDGPEQKALANLVDSLSLKEQVEFVGAVNNTYPYYEDAQVFVLPSLFEGFPMCSLEAMAHGLPVVGYRVCNGINVQIVNDENGILVAQSSQEGSLSEALEKLMSSSKLRKNMGKSSKDRYDRLYSNQVIFDAWEDLFQSAVEVQDNHKRPSLETVLQAQLDTVVNGKFL